MGTRRKFLGLLAGLPIAASAQIPGLKESNPSTEEDAAHVISYTLYAEARGESTTGKLAVASVIYTRSKLLDISSPEVCLMPRQFSCWNNVPTVPHFFITGDNLAPADALARDECYRIAHMLLENQHHWEFFTHYYNASKVHPRWANAMEGVKVIGRHTFGYIKGEFAHRSRRMLLGGNDTSVG